MNGFSCLNYTVVPTCVTEIIINFSSVIVPAILVESRFFEPPWEQKLVRKVEGSID